MPDGHGEAEHADIGFELSEALRRADLASVSEQLDSARDSATDAAEFVEEVLAPVQRMVGELWEAGRLDQSHVRVVTERVAADVDDIWSAVNATPPAHPRVAVACVFGEWHDLPARMMATALRAAGWDVVQLGPSVSVDTLRGFLQTERPLTVALSCTQSYLLPDALAAVRTARDCGVPVAVGGAAFGRSERRARAIGADLWTRSGARLARQLHAWGRRRPEVRAGPPARRAEVLGEEERALVLDSALRYLERTNGMSGDSDNRSARPAGILAFAEAAVLTDDDTVLDDAIAWWLRRARATRREESVTNLFDALAASTPPGPLRSLLLRTRARL